MADREALPHQSQRVSYLVELTFAEADDDLGVLDMLVDDACELVEGHWRVTTRRVPWADVRGLAMMAAGIGSGAVMREAPDVVMPAEEVSRAVDELLVSFGVPRDG